MEIHSSRSRISPDISRCYRGNAHRTVEREQTALGAWEAAGEGGSVGGACRMSSSRVQRGQAQPECGECGAEGLALWHPGRGESMRHRA